MSKTHWKRLMNPNYIGAYYLNPGQDLTVKITKAGNEEVKTAQGKETCLVLHLEGHKPMILNVTNSKSIEALYGPYIEDWAGKEITLYAEKIKAFGEWVEALRIRKQVVKADVKKDKLTKERFTKMIDSIKSGQFKIDQAFKMFAFSSKQESDLFQVFCELVQSGQVDKSLSSLFELSEDQIKYVESL